MESRASFDLPSSGTGGMRPAQRVPGEWQKSQVPIGKEPDQGPMKTSRPTMRCFDPGAGAGDSRSFSSSVIDARPGVVAQRALAPIPGEVVTVLAMGVGGAVDSHLVGGSFVSTAPGNNDNVAGNGDFDGVKLAKGSATRTTGRPVEGQTQAKGMI